MEMVEVVRGIGTDRAFTSHRALPEAEDPTGDTRGELAERGARAAAK